MRLIGNVIWLVFAGIWMALAYLFAGLIMCILIITIPFGIQSFKLAAFALWPFGRTVVKRADAGVASGIGNIIWFVLAGWWLAIGHLLTSIPLFLSIIGIPLAIGNLKMIPISLLPFGREIVDIDALDAAYSDAVIIGS
ncbi:MAG: YccF domain-containing protein [Actinomycetes bacterium]